MRDLVDLPVTARRLGCRAMDIVEDDTVYPRIHEAHEGAKPYVNALPTSMVSNEK
jgi:hypothetical protein